MRFNSLFYLVKPFIPRRIQLMLRRSLIMRQKKKYENIWPILKTASILPHGWTGWPDRKQFALVLTHDVESKIGHEKCVDLMQMEQRLGFYSSFNFVPERYTVDSTLRNFLNQNGFEVGVHGLYHDGKLFSSRKTFDRRALRINSYLREWSAVGFRAPAMHHNLEWIHQLDIEYDASTFDTDPFEPQSDGTGTIFPFYVAGGYSGNGYVELPYTLPQDFTLFILMKEKNIDIWKQKLDWVAEMGGMALVNTHPDYMNFHEHTLKLEEYSAHMYEIFLNYVATAFKNAYWNALPKQLSRYFRDKYVSKKDGQN